MEDLPTPRREAPPEASETPVEDKPEAPKASPARPSLPSPPPLPPTPPTPAPKLEEPPPTPKKEPTPPPRVEEKVPPPPPPPAKPPTVTGARAGETPARGPARIRRILTFLSILFIVVLVGVLGYFVLREVIFPPQREVTLTYWGLWEDPDIINPLLTDFIASYTSEHPDVSLTINYEKRTFGTLEQHKDTLLTRLRRGTGPDVFRLHNSWIKGFVDELSPLPANLMSEGSYASAFYPVALTSAKVGEQIYAIPLEYDGLVLFYNKTLLKGVKVGSALSTWTGFRQEARKLTQWEGNDPARKITQAGAAFGTANNVSHSADLLSLLLAQSKLDPLKDLNTEAAAYVLDYYTAFVKEDHIWDETLPFSIDAFANGQVAMVFGPSWRALNIRDRNPQLEFAAVPVPQLPEAQEVHWATFWMEAVNKDSANADIAWELLKFLSQEEQQRKFYSAASQTRYFGEPYSRPSLAEDLATHEILGPILTGASKAVSSKTVDFSGNKDYVDAFKQAISDVLGKKDAEEALETAQATINQLEGVTTPED